MGLVAVPVTFIYNLGFYIATYGLSLLLTAVEDMMNTSFFW